jgi:hypothetical protein
MFGLEHNIYNITTIMSMNDTCIPHDMRVINFGIVWNYILLDAPSSSLLDPKWVQLC